MISPFTPPGTKVVCINAEPTKAFSLYSSGFNLHGLEVGRVYTVSSIEKDPRCVNGFAVILCELERAFGQGYALARFRRADLPSCLTELLKPVHIPREELV